MANGGSVALRPGSADSEIMVVSNCIGDSQANLGKKRVALPLLRRIRSNSICVLLPEQK
jgi:hypothetical protein